LIFTVVWVIRAEHELAALWLASADRAAVTRATHEIEQRLHRHPQEEGESRGVDQRVTFVPPLGVLFEVDEDDRIVWVLQVWAFDTHAE
jgi:hypothetical protein